MVVIGSDRKPNFGTEGYAAPYEANMKANLADDMYSFGKTLLECLRYDLEYYNNDYERYEKAEQEILVQYPSISFLTAKSKDLRPAAEVTAVMFEIDFAENPKKFTQEEMQKVFSYLNGVKKNLDWGLFGLWYSKDKPNLNIALETFISKLEVYNRSLEKKHRKEMGIKNQPILFNDFFTQANSSEKTVNVGPVEPQQSKDHKSPQ